LAFTSASSRLIVSRGPWLLASVVNPCAVIVPSMIAGCGLIAN
jgi:hypothetical protein